MNRLPIRWRLTLAFALALTAVLTAVAVYLHVQLSTDLDRDIVVISYPPGRVIIVPLDAIQRERKVKGAAHLFEPSSVFFDVRLHRLHGCTR